MYAIEAMAARCRGYLAGLQSWVSPRTRQTLLGGEPFGSFDHAYDALGGVAAADLLAFEADLKSTRGWEFKYGSRNWSVVEADGVRALLNNEAPAAVQSSVRLDGGPPPLSGRSGPRWAASGSARRSMPAGGASRTERAFDRRRRVRFTAGASRCARARPPSAGGVRIIAHEFWGARGTDRR